ncbi:MAG: hypothetical protein RR704_00865 [Stenotrophomonas sp.]
MDSETKGRLLGLEALVSELICLLPADQARAAIARAQPALLRQPQDIAPHSMKLVNETYRRIPKG